MPVMDVDISNLKVGSDVKNLNSASPKWNMLATVTAGTGSAGGLAATIFLFALLL